jgi:hypothetical protein
MSRQAKKDESLIVAASKTTYREKLVVLLLISIFILLMVIAFTGFSPFVVKLNTADANSVYQGIGIGCLLSIFAIVISLALMAVQYASQQYTHRIMDFYTKSRMFQCILFIYMGTIFYNMLMLTEKTVNPTHMFVSLSLSALCILALLPHFFITMTHLRPGFIIGKMLSGINRKDIDSGSVIAEDPLLPITEIIERAIRTGDRTTARTGLDELKDCYLQYSSPVSDEDVSPYFLTHIRDVGRVAIISADDGSMVQVLSIFGEIGREKTVPEKMYFSSKIVLEYIDTIGFKALQNYDAAAEQMINSLQEILGAVIRSGKGEEREEEKEILKQIFTLYSNLSDELFELKKEEMIKNLLNSFSEPVALMKEQRALIVEMVNNRRYETIEKTAVLLVGISVHGAKCGFIDLFKLSISSLHAIGIYSAKKELVWETPRREINIATDLIVEHLLDMKLKVEEEAKSTELRKIMIEEIDFAKKDIERYLEDSDNDIFTTI